MSTVGAISGTFARILSFDGGKKWIIRLGRERDLADGIRGPDGERTEEVSGWTHDPTVRVLPHGAQPSDRDQSGKR